MARTRADEIRRAAAGAAARRGSSTRRGEQENEKIIVIVSMMYIMMMLDSCYHHHHCDMTYALMYHAWNACCIWSSSVLKTAWIDVSLHCSGMHWTCFGWVVTTMSSQLAIWTVWVSGMVWCFGCLIKWLMGIILLSMNVHSATRCYIV